MNVRSVMRGEWPLGLRFVLLTAGFILWSSCFVLLYASQWLGCQAGLQNFSLVGINGMTFLLLGIGVSHLLLLGWLSWLALRNLWTTRNGENARFLDFAIAMLNVGALVSTAWITFPVLLLPPCA